MPRRPVNQYKAYHAHVYFGPGTVEQARALCEEAAQRFGVAMGRVHEKNVGPHPQWSYQLAFSAKDFDPLVAWLDAHRDGLDILVHALTGDDIADHTQHAYWLGDEHVLDLSAL